LGVIIANLEPVSKIVAAPALKWAFVAFGFSVVIGVIVRSIGICVSQMIQSTTTLSEHLFSDIGIEIQAAIEPKLDEVLSKVSDPFIGPMRWWTNYSGSKGTQDFILTEKRCVTMLCLQLYLGILQVFLGVAGIMILAFGITG
jgi:hypothetical protein